MEPPARSTVTHEASRTQKDKKLLPPPPRSSDFQAPAPIAPKRKARSTTSTTTPAEPEHGTAAAETASERGENVGKEASVATEMESAKFIPPKPKTLDRPVASGGAGYRPPSWAPTTAPAGTGLSLTVLKGGVEVNSISLDNRTHCLLGRQQGVVDVILEHPSISRQHAVLQHGERGSVFLFDNGSTHGCTVNKKKIAPKEFHRLNVGDVIKFGESTRLYVLEGPQELLPAEYESENLRNLRHEAARKQLALKIAEIKAGGGGGTAGGEGDSGEYGISWGFDEDAIAEVSDEEGEEGMEGVEGEVELPEYLKTEAQKRRRRDTKLGLSEDNVHKRDAKLFEKLQQKLAKVEHLLTENERITAKEGSQGGLTEGQQAQLARNDKSITAVRLQVEEIEESIRQKNKARERGKELEEGGGKASGLDKKSSKEAEGEDDDDFYDRTAPIKASAVEGTTDGGIASKKAEVRARRFARRDKTKKIVSTSNATGVPAIEAAETGKGSHLNEASALLSLEALIRRSEVVGQDLARAEEGLVELEAEEAEEAVENESVDGEVSSDPLDAFMASNRQSARRQATSRLSTQRDSLRREQAQLKLMVEAAKPSMPQLKMTTTADPHTPTEDDQKNSASRESSDCSPLDGYSDDAAATMGLEFKQSGGNVDYNSPSVKAQPRSRSEAGAAGALGGRNEDNMSGAEGQRQPDRPKSFHGQTNPGASNERAIVDTQPDERSRETSGQLPLRPSQETLGPPQASTLRRLSEVEATEASGVEVAASGEDKDIGVPTSDRRGKGALAGGAKTEGVKRRDTSVGAAMLPPPPTKRRQRGLSPPSSQSQEPKVVDVALNRPVDRIVSSVKRKVRGPEVIPSPEKMPHSQHGENAGESMIDRKRKASGDGVLEGGDADWVPPKGQAGDGRTSLNLKFGY